jgi:glycosyltransferase involved in cell wall biosynthesis
MKKTLIICSQYPLPENTGANIRSMNFVHFFKNLGSVDIAYSWVFKGGQTGNPIFSIEYFLELKEVKSFWERLVRWLNIIYRPIPILKYNDDSQKKLLSIIKTKDYDYIFVRYIINTNILFKLNKKYKVRTIIDFDDVLSGSLYESEIASANGTLRKLRLRLNHKFLVNYEKKCLNFGASFFCSEKDRDRVIKNNNKKNVFVIPNVYENKSFEDYNFGDGFRNGNILLFIGTLGYKPNIDGLKWFVESVFPDFKKVFSDAMLLVVGRSPREEIKKICESKASIELHGDVDDVKDYYRRCKAVVVPLLAGGGTRIKILEAALANRPVLSTPIGAEGLDLANETDLLLFENAHDFSTQYSKLLNKDKYNSIVHNAKKLVLTKYSAKNFNDAMERVLIELNNKKHSI